MTPPTAALPCPNPKCGAECRLVMCVGSKVGRAQVYCTKGCGYLGVEATGYVNAIELHNALCAPAVQATADADGAAKEIVAGDLFDPEHTGWSLNKSVPIEVVTERISAIIRKAASPKAADEEVMKFIESFKTYYPDLGQLISAFKTATDYAWSDWDESVRLNWMKLGDMAYAIKHPAKS